jgi:hypothetical protein
MHADYTQLVGQLPGPLKKYPVLMETRQVYMVWIEDHEEQGRDKLIQRERDSGDAYEYLGPNPTPIDGDFTVLEADDWSYSLHDDSVAQGPWQVCPFPGCERPSYPAYGADPACFKHSVRGCDRINLPTKEFA